MAMISGIKYSDRCRLIALLSLQMKARRCLNISGADGVFRVDISLNSELCD